MNTVKKIHDKWFYASFLLFGLSQLISNDSKVGIILPFAWIITLIVGFTKYSEYKKQLKSLEKNNENEAEK